MRQRSAIVFATVTVAVMVAASAAFAVSERVKYGSPETIFGELPMPGPREATSTRCGRSRWSGRQ
jgi:hypothetical protein